MVLGTVTPHDDGTWSAYRYGPGYPANSITGVSETGAVDYVADGEELGDGPKLHPAIEAFWKEQESVAKAYFEGKVGKRSSCGRKR